MAADPRVLEADVVVNIPKLKAHTQARLTGAVKNLYGCVPGRRKVWWHVQARHNLARFCDMLVENARAMQAGLTVVDAVVAMEGQGPRRGTPRQVGLVVAGDDVVAVDAVLCALVGLPADRCEVLKAAARRGIGTPAMEAIRMVGEPLEKVRVEGFRWPEELEDISFDVPRLARGALRRVWLRLVSERRPYGA